MGDITDASLVVTQRKRGRPRSLEPKSAVMAWVPVSYHDRLAQIAQRRGDSISSVVCEAIEKALKDQRRS